MPVYVCENAHAHRFTWVSRGGGPSTGGITENALVQEKPAKSCPAFVLYADGNRQWAKMIKNQIWFFGQSDYPDVRL